MSNEQVKFQQIVESFMIPTNIDLICLSHLRWGFVFQRPQHLMSRIARERRVYFVEEPLWEDTEPHFQSRLCEHTGVRVLTPVMQRGLSDAEAAHIQRGLLAALLSDQKIVKHVAWYYTPMALAFTQDLRPELTVYDCMDELSAFSGAPSSMALNEQELFGAADLVFTGGATLYEWKRRQHSSVHLFPSSIDVSHFVKARNHIQDPSDQEMIPAPRLGYAGVIDERMDLDLIRSVSAFRPEWQFVFLGPIVKIDPTSLPSGKNIHYLGMKNYRDLPLYFSGWQIGMLPFALNDSTRFISPTKTPEYLGAGLRVISTPIRDVVTPYGDLKLAEIAGSAGEFVRAAERLLKSPTDDCFRRRVDQFLSQSSWNKTWASMSELIEQCYGAKQLAITEAPELTVSPIATPEGLSHV